MAPIGAYPTRQVARRHSTLEATAAGMLAVFDFTARSIFTKHNVDGDSLHHNTNNAKLLISHRLRNKIQRYNNTYRVMRHLDQHDLDGVLVELEQQLSHAHPPTEVGSSCSTMDSTDSVSDDNFAPPVAGECGAPAAVAVCSTEWRLALEEKINKKFAQLEQATEAAAAAAAAAAKHTAETEKRVHVVLQEELIKFKEVETRLTEQKQELNKQLQPAISNIQELAKLNEKLHEEMTSMIYEKREELRSEHAPTTNKKPAASCSKRTKPNEFNLTSTTTATGSNRAAADSSKQRSVAINEIIWTR